MEPKSVPEAQISLFAVLLAVGLVQAVFLLLSLLTTGQERRYANHALAALMGLFIYELLNQFLHESDYIALIPQLSPFSRTTDLLYGPIIYLYVSRVTQQQALSGGFRLFFHLIPALITLPINLYHALVSPRAGLIQYARELDHDLVLLDISDTIIMTIGLVSIFSYLLASLARLRRHQRIIGDNFSYREAIDLQWLKSILIILWILYLVYFLSFMLAVLDIEFSATVYNLLFIGIVCSIFWMGYRGIRQPHVFSEPVAELEDAPDASIDSVESNGEEREVAERYRSSGIDEDESRMIFAELESFLERSQLFLEPKLTLAQLAEQTGFKSHYLSQAINQNRNVNFFDFINQYRIDFAKQRLGQDGEGQLNVLEVAMESGFNSKSSFYTAFRKYTGVTPNQYRKASVLS